LKGFPSGSAANPKAYLGGIIVLERLLDQGVVYAFHLMFDFAQKGRSNIFRRCCEIYHERLIADSDKIH
jgi:hypothetical protein